MQFSPPAFNKWHDVSISKKSGEVFTWKNRAGVEWDLILVGEESGGVVKFEVRRNCSYDKDKDKDKDKYKYKYKYNTNTNTNLPCQACFTTTTWWCGRTHVGPH